MGGHVGPEDIVPFLELALQQLLTVFLDILALLIAFTRSFSGNTSVVEPTCQLCQALYPETGTYNTLIPFGDLS